MSGYSKDPHRGRNQLDRERATIEARLAQIDKRESDTMFVAAIACGVFLVAFAIFMVERAL